MTATAYAVTELGYGSSALRGVHARHAFLALAALVDFDLDRPSGHDYVTADRIATVVGLASSTVDRTLRGVRQAVMVVTGPAGRELIVGDAKRCPTGAKVLGYRITEEAFR